MTFLQLLSRTDGGKERFQKSITNLSLTRHKKKKTKLHLSFWKCE